MFFISFTGSYHVLPLKLGRKTFFPLLVELARELKITQDYCLRAIASVLVS